MFANVPVMPEMQWKDGKADFSHLDGKATVRDQLQTLISDQNAGAILREVGLGRCHYEVTDEDGESTVYVQPYIVTNGKASLDGHCDEVPAEEFATLSKRRIRRGGVPDPTNPEDE